jgi:hypothetical protein
MFKPNNLPAPVTFEALKSHRDYFKVLNQVKGCKKLVMLAFLALLAFNFVYAIWTPEPAQAFLFDDLTALGRSAGDNYMAAAELIIKDIYSGTKYPLLSWLSKTCLLFAGPIAAVGIIQLLSEDEIDNPIPKNVVIVSIAMVICLSGGGFIAGQLYLFLYYVLEGFFKGMDGFLNAFDAIQSAKAYIASNAMLASSVSTCTKFVGQEQARCIAEASANAQNMLGDVQKNFGPLGWVVERTKFLYDIGQKMGKDIATSGDPARAIASNAFFLFAAPASEITFSTLATIGITIVTMLYAVVLAFAGLGLPVSLLASMLVPGFNAAWVGWIVGIGGIWFFRMSYLLIMWFCSKILTTTDADTFASTAWFGLLGGIFAPLLTGLFAGVGALAIYGNIASATAQAAQSAIQIAMYGGGGGGGSPPPQPQAQAQTAMPPTTVTVSGVRVD